MQKGMRKMRTALALMLCIAMSLTTVLDTGLLVRAAETAEATEAVETVEATEAVGVSEEADKTAAVEETTVSVGDLDASILEYQRTKLKVTKKNTTVFAGQKGVVVANVQYAATTKKEGRYFTGEVEYTFSEIAGPNPFSVYYPELPEGQEPNTVDGDDNGETVMLDINPSALPGKYNLVLKPVVPEGVHAEKTVIPITVKAPIALIDLDVPPTVYKADKKAASFQANAELQAAPYGNTPSTTKVKWSVYKDEDCTIPFEATEVTVNAKGKVSINKNYQVTEENNMIYVKVVSDDYERTEETSYLPPASDVEGVRITTAAQAPDKLLVYLADEQIAEEKLSKLTAGEIGNANLYLRVVDKDGAYLDGNAFTYTSSNAKAISVDEDGKLSLKKITGKPVTITATAKDGSKKKVSAKLTFVKKAVDNIDNVKLKIRANVIEGGSAGEAELTSNVFTLTKENPKLEIATGNKDYMNVELSVNGGDSREIYDMKVSFKGAKDLTGSALRIEASGGDFDAAMGTMMYAIVPTSDQVTITVKAGGKKQEFVIVNTGFSKKKLTSAKGQPKITTVVDLPCEMGADVKLYAGKENAGKLLVLQPDMQAFSASLNNYLSTMLFLNFIHIYGCYTIDEDGYVVIEDISVPMYNAYGSVLPLITGVKNIKLNSSVKFVAYIADTDGKALCAPYTINFKIPKAKATKTDYKLKNAYTMEYNGESDFFETPITYNGSKAPKAKLVSVDDVRGGLSADLLDSDAWTKHTEYELFEEEGEWRLGISADTEEQFKYLMKEGSKKVTGTVYVTYTVKTPKGENVTTTEPVELTIDFSKRPK